MKMSIEKLGPTFFAQVKGINVNTMTNAQTSELQQAYLDYKVLVIEEQSLEAVLACKRRHSCVLPDPRSPRTTSFMLYDTPPRSF